MAEGSAIGFHAAYQEKGGMALENGMANALVGAYLNSLGLSSSAVSYITHAAPNSMQWLTVADAEAIGIDVRVFQHDGSGQARTATAPQTRQVPIPRPKPLESPQQITRLPQQPTPTQQTKPFSVYICRPGEFQNEVQHPRLDMISGRLEKPEECCSGNISSFEL